jgi:hypothetical protein
MIECPKLSTVSAVAMVATAACSLLVPTGDYSGGHGPSPGDTGTAWDESRPPADRPKTDASGPVAAPDAQPATSCGDAGPTLLGEKDGLQPTIDELGMGDVEAFSYTAKADGCATTIWFFVPAGNPVPTVELGLYDSADASGKLPSNLIASAKLNQPSVGWNAAPMDAAVELAAGATYWIGVLQPVTDGGLKKMNMLDRGGAADATTSFSYGAGMLGSLPTQWPPGYSTWSDGPVAAYVQ